MSGLLERYSCPTLLLYTERIMKERTKNILAYTAFFGGAMLVGGSILAGDFSRYTRDHSTADNQADADNVQASLYDYAKTLEASDNPRDLAVSAFLQVSNKHRDNPEQAFVVSQDEIALLKKALALGQNDATLAWFEAVDCGWMSAACDKDAALIRLSKLEPDNAAVEFLYLNKAQAVGNTEAAWQAIERGGQKKYFRLPIDAIGAMYYESLRNWHSPVTLDPKDVFGKNTKDLRPVSQEEYRKITAFGFSIAVAIPALQDYSTYCRPAPTNLSHLKICQQFTDKFAAGDSMLLQGMGTRMGTELFLQSPEKEQWQARRNQHQWQQMQYSEILQSDPGADRVYFEKWPGISENERIEALLNAKGISLSPPAGWSFEEKR